MTSLAVLALYDDRRQRDHNAGRLDLPQTSNLADDNRLAKRHANPVLYAPRDPTRSHGASSIEGQFKFAWNIGSICHDYHCATSTQIEYRATNQLFTMHGNNFRRVLNFRALEFASLWHAALGSDATALQSSRWQFLE